MIPHRAITLAARAPVASVSGAGGMGGLERSRTWEGAGRQSCFLGVKTAETDKTFKRL